MVCWSNSITAAERKRLNKLIKRASSVLGCSLHPVEVVGDRKMIALHVGKNVPPPSRDIYITEQHLQ